MSKYDKYENDLVNYINLIVSQDIKDITGDIIGDIQDFSMPSNIPSGSTSISALTVSGPIVINIEKKHTTTNIEFYHQMGDNIYERYHLSLDDIPLFFIVYGESIERRTHGFIHTTKVRKYDFCNHDDAEKRLTDSEEKRDVYDNDIILALVHDRQIFSFPLDEMLIKFRNIKSLSLLKGIHPLITTTINTHLPNYISANYRPGEDEHIPEVYINELDHSQVYSFLTCRKNLEIIDEFLHGNISSLSIPVLKQIINEAKIETFFPHLSSFNLLSKYYAKSSDGISSNNNLFLLESIEAGSPPSPLPKEYYLYLKELLDEYLLPEDQESHNLKDIVRLVKENTNEDLKSQ